MRKLGVWGGPVLATMLLVAGMAGLAAAPALAQDRAVPWLGVMTQSLDDGLREGLDYRGEGVLVSQVVGDSPASRAGIRKGDILVSVNSRSVESPSELSEVVHSSRVGQNVSIVLLRDRQRRTVSARLGERPENEDMPGTPDMDDMRELPHGMDHDLGRGRDGQGENEGEDHGPGMLQLRGMGRGRLGIRVEDLNGDLGSYFDVPSGKGALVVEVMEGTPADKAGLRSGDVITDVAGHDIAGAQSLIEALRDQPKGDVSITVIRKGNRRTVQAELDEAPRMMRGPGRDLTIIRPRMDSRPSPEERRELRKRDSSSDDSEEVRELREEVRQLREKLDQLQNDKDKDNDDGRDHD